MKKYLRKVMALVMVMVCCFAMAFSADAASAPKMKVTYKGKTVTILDTAKSEYKQFTTYTTVEKSWGAANTTKKFSAYQTFYTFKKGKSTIVANYRTKASGDLPKGYTSYEITIKDKNMKVNGVYVGMTKAAALKSLRNTFGKANVSVDTKSKIINVQCGMYMPIQFTYNSAGKITKIYFFAS